jgi:hypothetical protein
MEIGWSGENLSSTGAYILRAISAEEGGTGPRRKEIRREIRSRKVRTGNG